MATVYVGIVTYNSIKDIPRCVASLQAQTYLDLQTVVLDNASNDESATWARSKGLKVIANADNVGFARAHNKILSSCRLTPDDFYMPLNPDVVLTPDYIKELVAIIAVTKAGWATGKLLSSNYSGTIYSIGHGLRRDGYFFNIGNHQEDQGQFSVPCEVFGAPGAASLISAKLIRDICVNDELFDSAMFMYGEDTDLDWRARRAGWRCWYTPAAIAYHHGSNPGEELKIEAIANRYLSVLKNAYLFDLLAYNIPVIVAHIVFRLVATPRLGAQLAGQLVRNYRSIWLKRTPPRISRKAMIVWFTHPASTNQPIRWRSRIAWFLSNIRKSRIV